MVHDSSRFIESKALNDILGALVSTALKQGFAVDLPGAGDTSVVLSRRDGNPIIRVVFLEGDELPGEVDPQPEEPEVPLPLTESEFDAMPYDAAPDAGWKGRGDNVTLLPIAGGCVEFVPSPEDWDALNAMDDFPTARTASEPAPNRYTPEALIAFRKTARASELSRRPVADRATGPFLPLGQGDKDYSHDDSHRRRSGNRGRLGSHG
jgi:hypothetical protein